MESRSGRRTASATTGTRVGTAVCAELPSGHYPPIEEANRVLLRRAAEPPHPVLPKARAQRTWQPTKRECNPLTSGLTGAGRAGAEGKLLGTSGGHYKGGVMAGRPHGYGQYYASQTTVGQPGVLLYDGEWAKGAREGSGTRHYFNKETYSGHWLRNMRHGQGTHAYANGDVYEGEWANDKRHGRGTYRSAGGDVFVGSFVDDRREGMGTLFMIGRGKKLVAEYVKDRPTCGSVFDISDDDPEPLPAPLRDSIKRGVVMQALQGNEPAKMPPLQLQQPSKVLAQEMVAVRRAREQHKAKQAAVQKNCSTLTSAQMNLLRHSFVMLSGGDHPEASVLPKQLNELCLLAGFDPAAPATQQLVAQVLARAGPGPVYLDSVMHVVCHFSDKAALQQAWPAEADAAGDAADDTNTQQARDACTEDGSGYDQAADGGDSYYGEGGDGAYAEQQASQQWVQGSQQGDGESEDEDADKRSSSAYNEDRGSEGQGADGDEQWQQGDSCQDDEHSPADMDAAADGGDSFAAGREIEGWAEGSQDAEEQAPAAEHSSRPATANGSDVEKQESEAGQAAGAAHSAAAGCEKSVYTDGEEDGEEEDLLALDAAAETAADAEASNATADAGVTADASAADGGAAQQDTPLESADAAHASSQQGRPGSSHSNSSPPASARPMSARPASARPSSARPGSALVASPAAAARVIEQVQEEEQQDEEEQQQHEQEEGQQEQEEETVAGQEQQNGDSC